jgi:NitT/TauT family transport system substrate-binding protein
MKMKYIRRSLRFLKAVQVVAVILGLGTVFLAGTALAETVTLNLDWIPYGKHAWNYAALDLGYYKDAGLEVKIVRGYGSGDTLKRIAAKRAEFGFADYGSLVIARAKGAKVKGTAVLQAKAPYGINALTGSGIKTPKDLEGKRVGQAPGGAQAALWPAFAAMAGIDLSKVKQIDMSPAAITGALLAGKVDASIANYTSQRVIYLPLAKKQGKGVVTIAWADYGMDVYANGFITHDDTIASKPKLVRRFMGASMKGVAWTVENPEKAIARLRKHHPAIGAEIGLKMLQWHNGELMVEEAKVHGIGWVSKEKMTRTRDVVLKANKLRVNFPVEDLYTMEFRPKLFPKWKRPSL